MLTRHGVALLFACVAIQAISRQTQAQQTETVWHPTLGLTLGAPYSAWGYLGVTRMTHLPTEWQTFRGVGGIAELGRGGGQFAIARVWEEEGLMSRLQGAVVRTWGESVEVEPGQTYVSAQIQSSFVFGANLGAYWRGGGPVPADEFFSAGCGGGGVF